MRLPYLRVPRAIDPRRHHDVQVWADAERENNHRHAPLGWRERAIYSALGIAVLLVAAAAFVRLT
jgi:hypothetical protein